MSASLTTTTPSVPGARQAQTEDADTALGEQEL
jgi:hypothetical protein